MPEQPAVEVSSWTPESVEKQAAEMEQQQAQQEAKPAEPAQAEVEQAEPEKKERDKTDNLVSAVTELRAQRREAHARATALEQTNAQLTRQMQEMMAFLQKQQQPQQAAPAADDVVGQLQHGVAQTRETVAFLAQQQQQEAARRQQEAQWNQYVSTVKAQEAEFTKTQPDAVEAIGFLKTARVNEYKAAGLTHQQAVERMQMDERQLIDWALQSGENPAKAAFDMAVARGYVSPKKKLEMQREGQGASMPAGGAGKGGGTPSLESLLKMDSKDFAKATEGDNWEKLLRKFS
jgi:predicted RNase H-like nuclease (RuvC/YqgF family)